MWHRQRIELRRPYYFGLSPDQASLFLTKKGQTFYSLPLVFCILFCRFTHGLHTAFVFHTIFLCKAPQFDLFCLYFSGGIFRFSLIRYIPAVHVGNNQFQHGIKTPTLSFTFVTDSQPLPQTKMYLHEIQNTYSYLCDNDIGAILYE